MNPQQQAKNELVLSRLGIGCWSFGSSVEDYWGAQDQREVESLVGAALDQGITYFDTAEAYNEGRSEEALGRALKGRRSEAIIGSKVWPNHASPELLRHHCEASLRRLGTDFIDLYMLHWPLTEFPLQPAMETLALLKEEGKIRFIGLSNFGAEQVRQAAATGVAIATNQLCYNLLSRAIEFEILPECRRLHIGVIAYMPLQQGLLTGKYHSTEELPAMRTRTRHFSGSRPHSRHGEPGAEAEIFTLVETLRDMSAETRATLSQMALSWVANQDGIASTLTGIRNRQQLDEAAAGVSFPLSVEVLRRMTELSEEIKQKLGPNADYFQSTANSRVR
ncbi:MAG: aldo/keto reductase [Anaerolineaceae bacterium]|nr:aldo/keto reductase [Anaerolineaceae bacterium]